ncbi:hypothetical protein F5Y03DRAFT_263031 [Xylaria venustula]|nr:hypothetical protein F5Y03DRAFT_263031 [Xylaria venustula]
MGGLGHLGLTLELLVSGLARCVSRRSYNLLWMISELHLSAAVCSFHKNLQHFYCNVRKPPEARMNDMYRICSITHYISHLSLVMRILH